MSDKWHRLLVIIAVGGVALLLAERFGPGGRQRRGSKAAHEFHARIAPTLAIDPRFVAVETRLTSHPAIYVHGQVPDARALADLQQLFQVPSDVEFRVIMNVAVAGGTTSLPGG